MSPRYNILSTSFFILSAASRVCKETTEPSLSKTIGPSIVSQQVIVAAFPGRSTFNWVPMAIKFSNTSYNKRGRPKLIDFHY